MKRIRREDPAAAAREKMEEIETEIVQGLESVSVAGTVCNSLTTALCSGVLMTGR